MSEADPTCLCCLTYFIKERFFRKAIHTAEEYLKLYKNDPLLLFFKAHAKVMEGRTQEAIRELERLKDSSSMEICSVQAIIFAHLQCETVDRESVKELESHVKTIRTEAGESALYYGGLFYWLIGRADKAKNYVDKVLKMSKMSSKKQGLILKGWLDMSSKDEFQRNNAIKYLDSGVQGSMDVFGLMAKVKYFMDKQNFSGSLEIVNQIIISHPTFLPGLLMKMNLFLALQDWEQAVESALKILQHDGRNLNAIQVLALCAIVREGDQVKCGDNPEILQLLTQFAERLFAKKPANAEIANEIGYLMALQQKSKEAHHWYTTALNAGTSFVTAMAGLIMSQLIDGQLQEAESHLEFHKETQKSTGQSAELTLVQAMLAHKKGAGLEVVSPLLKEATEIHFLGLQGCPLGPEYFRLLHPNFIFQVVSLHLSYVQDVSITAGQPLPFALSHSMMILEPVLKTAPGLQASAFHMAHAKFLAGDCASAQRYIGSCLGYDPAMAEVHLLQAKIYLHEKEYTKCFQALETAVSHDFKVREFPRYHLIKSRALRATKDLEAAIQCLKMGMSLPGVRREAKNKDTNISNHERVSVFLDLAEALRLNGEQHEATMVMQEAIENFRGTAVETRVTFANVDLALAKCNEDIALNILMAITPDQPHYIEARQKMADMYLLQRRDKNLYIACYREIRTVLPGLQSSILLGDAYMKIQEPERAIEVYQDCIGKTRDATLARKMGQAYVKTHQYSQALAHYESAMKLGGQQSLFEDFAELLVKLRQYTKAQEVLTRSLQSEDGASVSALISNVKCLLLLVKTYCAEEGPVQDNLEKAYKIQEKILKHVNLQQPEILPQQTEMMASICCRLARFYRHKRNIQKAKTFYVETLDYNRGCDKITLEFAQFYLESGKLAEAEDQCNLVLQKDEKHGDARMVMGDIKFRQEMLDESLKIYNNLMIDYPDNYVYMVGCIQKHRRLGKLPNVPQIFKMIEKFNHRATSDPGYHYCKGLYYWHVCNVNEALFHLKKAYRDTVWGERALELMIRICLNPDNETIGGKLYKDPQKKLSLQEAHGGECWDLTGVATAQKLISEFRLFSVQEEKQKSRNDKIHLLTNLCLMATRDPKQVEKALQFFTDMAASRANNTAYLLAMAQACMLLKQTPKARNQLKRLSKVEWSEEQADDLEMAWLLLADIYIKTGYKYELAINQLKRCLKHNKSCSRAYEYLGYIYEKEQSYIDALEQYKQAWEYTNRFNPAIGFRLAFNYLKFKRYTKAVDVCRKVLEEHPDFPLIRTEVLRRAVAALKP
ncbi:tetratricopeptide repeat protein 21B-like [Centroberyx gerrardi]